MAGVRDLPGYNPDVKDGGLGATSTPDRERVGVCGVSYGQPATTSRYRNPNDAIDALVRGSGLEEVLTQMANGSREVVYREIDTDGGTAADAGTPSKEGTGAATAAVDGTPYVDNDIIITVITGGDIGTATYEFSLNGGLDYEGPRKFVETDAGPPAKSKLWLEGDTSAGAYYVEFTGDATSTDFVAGDTWTWSAREAIPTAGKTIDAVEALIKYRDAAQRPIGLRGNNWIYLAQKVADTSWDEICALVTDYWVDFAFPVNVETNVVPPEASEGVYDISAWVNELLAASEQLRYVTIPENNYEPGRLGLNAAFMMLGCSDGWRRLRPAGCVMAGLIAKTEKMHESIGWTKKNKIEDGVSGSPLLFPYNSSEDFVGNWDDPLEYLKSLSIEGHFLTVRYKPGYGAVPTDDWMMAPNGSDYFCIRNRRIVDKAINAVRDANFLFINSPGVSSDDMIGYQAALEEPLVAMRDIDGELSGKGFALTLEAADDVAVSGDVNASLDLVPTPTKKRLNITFRLRRSV